MTRPPERPGRQRRICFLGGGRYRIPRDPSQVRRWERLSRLGPLFVVDVSGQWRPRCVVEHARFYLLPRPPVPLLRYVVMAVGGAAITTWLVTRRRVEVVVAQSPYHGCVAALAITLARRLGGRARLAVESHGDFEEDLFLQRRVRFPRVLRALRRRVARFALERADALHAVSSSTEAQLTRWQPSRRVVRFPAWTDLDVFLQAGGGVRVRSATVLYVGVLTPRKGVDLLLDAFGRVSHEAPEARLSIVGEAVEKAYARMLLRQAERTGLAERIERLGWVPQTDLADLMARARVLVLPSRLEGLGRVLLEAMAAGTAVVASAVGGVQDLVEDGVTGFLVPPDDVETLAGRLVWILRHPDEVARVEHRAREFARAFFSADAHVDGYARLLEAAEGALPRGRRTRAPGTGD